MKIRSLTTPAVRRQRILGALAIVVCLLLLSNPALARGGDEERQHASPSE